MKPGIYPIEVYAGGTFDVTLTAFEMENGVPTQTAIDFSSYTTASLEVRPPWHFKKEEVRPAAIMEMTELTGITIAAEGVNLHLTAIETAALTFTKGTYALKLKKMVDTEEVIDIWFKGSFIVVPEV